MVRHKHHFKIAFALAIAAGSWGVYWLPQRILEDGGLTGGWGTISQMMIGILLLTPISLWRKYKGRTSGLEIPFVGFLTGSGFICYALSFLLTDVVRALIMFYMIPVWTTIFEIYFLKKRPGLERVLTLSLALGGLWVVFSQSNIIPFPQNAGDWLALIGGVLFGAGLVRLEISKTDGVFPVIFSFFVYGTIFNIFAGFILKDYLGPMPPIEAFASMFTFLVLISVFYFIPTGVVIMWSPSVLGAGLCAILYLSEIVVGVISAGILADETFGWREVVGSTMIVVGGVLAVVLAPKEEK